jgi:hypothetical protein
MYVLFVVVVSFVVLLVDFESVCRRVWEVHLLLVPRICAWNILVWGWYLWMAQHNGFVQPGVGTAQRRLGGVDRALRVICRRRLCAKAGEFIHFIKFAASPNIRMMLCVRVDDKHLNEIQAG